jgi:hypothetical protein
MFRIVTGHTADAWASAQELQMPKEAIGCVELPKQMSPAPRPPSSGSSPAWGPWGVQLAGDWLEGRVLATYEQLRRRYHSVLGDYQPLVLRTSHGLRGAAKYIVRVSEKSRASADALCTKLRAAGGACVVLRNPST